VSNFAEKTRKMITNRFSVILTLVLACSCAHDHEAAHGRSAEAEDHAHEGNEIVIEPADAERYGIATEKIVAGPFAEVVKVSGEVLPTASGRAVVSAPTSGVVTLASGITDGSQVRAGQTVATVSGRGITGGDANQAALAALNAAKREVDRLTPLLADGLVTRKEYNDAVAAYEAARASYSPGAATGSATAPRAGVITRILAGDGSYVDAGAPIAEVSATSRLTLRALLPASEGAFLPHISDAVITPHSGDAVRLSTLNGKLVSASGATAATMPGYIPVYFSFDNSDPSIVPGSALEVYLSSSSTRQGLSVPAAALAEQMGQMFVFVRSSDHGYEKRPVTTGRSDGERVLIESGLSEGEEVVTRGATFVRLAEQATVVPEGHSHNH